MFGELSLTSGKYYDNEIYYNRYSDLAAEGKPRKRPEKKTVNTTRKKTQSVFTDCFSALVTFSKVDSTSTKFVGV